MSAGVQNEVLENFVFAMLFLSLGPSLGGFLFRKTRCKAAALLVSFGTISAAIGLMVLGAKPIFDPSDGITNFNASALVFQLAGAMIMCGALAFTNEYTKKLISSRALDPSLRSSPLGLRYRR